MRNVKRKLALASIMLCGSVALGLGSLNEANVTAAADTLDGFSVKSAALRVPDEEYGAGIRYTISLGNVSLAEGATTSVLLIPTSSLGASELTVDLNNVDLRTYNDVQWKNLEDGTKEAYLHLYDVPPAQYATNISLRAYIDHDADPDTAPIYTNVVSASVAEVADWAYYNDTTLDEDAKATLQATYLTYKVFYHNEADVTETTGIYNQTLTAIAQPTKVGYTFGGWWNQAGTHQWDFATTKVSSTTTNLYAKWKEATDTAYTVKVFETTDGGKTQTEINVADFVVNRTGTTGADLDITAEANAVVTKLGKGYTLNASKSVLTGTIAADGTTELKIVVDLDEIVAARVGEDANTLLFFDRTFGAKQVTKATGNNYGYTTDKAYGNETGSLKVTFPNTAAHNTVDFGFNGYEFGANDYIEFYVYNDTSVGTLNLMFYYNHTTLLAQGEWTRVIASYDWFKQYNYFRFFGQANYFGSGTNVDGSVYISKVKVYSGFADLSAATGEWKIGETKFTGAPTIYNNVPSGSTDLQKNLYQTGDAVTMKLWNHGSASSSYAGFEATFANNIDATSEDKYVSFTAKGADASLFTIVPFNPSGSALAGATKAIRTRTEANGFVTYVFRIAKGNTVSKFRITPLGSSRVGTTGSVDIIFSNCTVGNYTSLRVGEDANTLFFFDSSLGATQVYKDDNVASISYTTDMKYGNEAGSTKIEGIQYHGVNSYVGYTLTSADKEWLADSDYIVFNVYSGATRRLFFMNYYAYSTAAFEIMPQAWSTVIIPAEYFKQNKWFIVNQVTPDKETQSGTFDLYFSRAVRYTASEVTKLENKGATDTWNVGSMTLVGAPTVANGPTESGVLTATAHKKATLIDNELIITFVRTSDGYINMKLANTIEAAANSEVTVTAVMYDYGRLNKLEGYINQAYKYTYVSHESVGGGYAKVTFRCTVTSACTISAVRFDVENHTGDGYGLATQLRIKDIAISVK